MKTWLDGLSIWKRITGNDEYERVSLQTYYLAIRDGLPDKPFEAPLVRLRQWLAERLHDMSPIYDNPSKAISAILGFAEVLNLPKTSNHVNPIIDPKTGGAKFTADDNKCALCSTWCCSNNPTGDKKKCVLFNKDLKIENYPVQQQRFIRGGRKYLEENPNTTTMKDVRFPLEPVPGKGKGKGAGGRAGGGGRGAGGGGAGRQATPIIGNSVLDVTEMLGGEFNELSFDEWLNSAQGGEETRQRVNMMMAGGDP